MADNGFLQAAIDLGLPGIALIGVGAASLASLFLAGYRRADRQERLVLLASGSGLAGLVVHSLVDVPNLWQTSLVAVATATAIAVRAATAAEGMPRPRSPTSKVSWRQLRAALAPATVVVTFVAMLYFWANLDGLHLR